MTRLSLETLRRRRCGLAGFVLLALSASLAAGLGPAAGPAQAAPCPNEALREAQTSEAFPEGTTVLPQCMALELVSPAKKFNQRVGSIFGGDPQLSASGERVMFSSIAALAGTPRQGGLLDRYISSRAAAGWETQSTAPPPGIITGTLGSAIPCSFTPDLSRWALYGSTVTQELLGVTTAFQGDLGGLFTPLGPTMTPITGEDPAALTRGMCEGASQDVSRFYFAVGSSNPGFTYLPGDPLPIGVGRANVYETYLDGGVPTVRLLQRDHAGTVYGGSCGAVIGSPSEGRRGSVSPDASRIYFTTNPGQPEGSPCDANAHRSRIMRRLQAPAGPEITELVANECTRVSPPCSSLDDDDLFVGASQEGDKVYFTTSRQLADSDLDTTEDLYLHDSSLPLGSQLTQVSAGEASSPTPGEGAEILGVPDFSGDGTHAYFVAKGVLAMTANLAGESAVGGQPNLYLYERDAEFPTGRTVFIAGLASGGGGGAAVPRLGPDPEDQSIGGDGHLFFFGTGTALTADDTDEGRVDLYRYDADTRAIERISKAAPGAQDSGLLEADPAGNFDQSGGPQDVSFDRWVSEDGETAVFATSEDFGSLMAPVAVHIWHAGEVSDLPFAERATLGMSGEEVAFISPKRLVPQDGDGAGDVYVARANGGFLPPPPPVPCAGEACQEPFAAAPPSPGTASQRAKAGNVKITPCKHGTVRRRGRCVRKRPARKAKQGQAKQRRGQANRSQGGRK